jgi:hypothetical protein
MGYQPLFSSYCLIRSAARAAVRARLYRRKTLTVVLQARRRRSSPHGSAAARPRRPPPDKTKKESAAAWPPGVARSGAARGAPAPTDKEHHPASPKSWSKHTAETPLTAVVETGLLSRATPYLASRHQCGHRRPTASRARRGQRIRCTLPPSPQLLKPDGCRAPPRSSHRAAGACHHQRLARARGQR